MCYVNNMKRIIPVILFLLTLTGCYNSGEPRERVLKIYNWADYIGDGVLEDFQTYYKEQTGENIRIVYQTFDINEIMLTKIEKGHEDFAVTVFTIGNQGLETLSTYIYADARKGGLTPELRPLSAIIFVVVLALLIAINYRAGKTQKKD